MMHFPLALQDLLRVVNAVICIYIYILTCIPEVLQAFCSQVKRPVESPRRIVETGAMIKLLNVLWLSGGIQLQFDGAFSKAPLNPFVDLLSTLAA